MFVKRAFLLFLVCLSVGLFPAAAQDTPPQAADYVPADFAGFIQIRMDNRTLAGLNASTFVAWLIQPGRVPLGDTAFSFDDFIPFNNLFNVENVSFLRNVLPWLEGDLVIAYRAFDGQLQADPGDILLILPTEGLLSTASGLSAIIEDGMEQQTYRGVPVYVGGQTAIALTSPAAFVGSLELVQAALDVQAGVEDALTDSEAYQAVRPRGEDVPLIFAYASGDYLLPAVSGLVGGQDESETLLAAFGAGLSQMRAGEGFETLLLNRGFDGAGVSLDLVFEADRAYYNARAVFHAREAGEPAQTAEFNNALLDMIPRNALLVHTGSDFEAFVYDVVAVLPLSNFAREMVGGLPIQTFGTGSELITLPEGGDVRAAIDQFFDALANTDGFDLQSGLLDHLTGNFAVALLPRPNNPVPVIQTPFDLLLLAETDDGEAALDGAGQLLQSLFALEPLEDETVDDWTFRRLGVNGQSVFNLGVKDGLLLFASGDAAERALAAGQGDNRLIDEAAWQAFGQRPDVYLDRDVFFNTFFPSVDTSASGEGNRTRLALNTTYQGDGLYELRLSAALPAGN